ncbi:MAG: type II secretion system protein J [Planctomycetota bacterium]
MTALKSLTKEFFNYSTSKSLHCRGFTLVEMMIAIIIFSTVIAIAYTITITVSTGFELQNFLENIQTKTEIVMFKINEEITETNPYYVWVKNYNDPLFNGDNKTLLAFPVPRDVSGNFTMKSNYYPDYRKIVMYVPYNNNGTAELRRYEIYSFPSYYLQTGFVFSASVNETSITLTGIPPILRSNGETVVSDLGTWTVNSSSGSPIQINLSISARNVPGGGTYQFLLSTYMGARNNN